MREAPPPAFRPMTIARGRGRLAALPGHPVRRDAFGWRVCSIALLLGVVAAALAVHRLRGCTLSSGFDYDDYHLVLAVPMAAEARGAFAGSWDSTGIEKPFYRPLTTTFYAWRFAVFDRMQDGSTCSASCCSVGPLSSADCSSTC